MDIILALLNGKKNTWFTLQSYFYACMYSLPLKTCVHFIPFCSLHSDKTIKSIAHIMNCVVYVF